jgi:hypothetical protein
MARFRVSPRCARDDGAGCDDRCVQSETVRSARLAARAPLFSIPVEINPQSPPNSANMTGRIPNKSSNDNSVFYKLPGALGIKFEIIASHNLRRHVDAL